MRPTIVAGTALTLGLATVPLAVHYWPGHTMGAVAVTVAAPIALGTLTPADAALVKKGWQASQVPAGSHLTAIKAPGAKVWAAFNADVSIGMADTAVVKSHDLIVALVRYPMPIADNSGDRMQGSPPSMTSGRSWIIDSTNGRVVETAQVGSFAPNGHTPLPSVLGTPTDLTNY